jgi:disulfide bond formation protein DsbB
MADTIASFIPIAAVISHAVLVLFILVFIFRNSWGKDWANFVGKHAILLAFLTALSAVLGSFFYSDVMGFEPCSLCWWQRVLIFPQAIILLIALVKRNRGIFSYTLPLTVISGIIALYQTYADLGGSSILPCTAAGGSCDKVYVLSHGYITIASMSLTIAAYLILVILFSKFYVKNNSHA